jgi:hypothetical protein
MKPNPTSDVRWRNRPALPLSGAANPEFTGGTLRKCAWGRPFEKVRSSSTIRDPKTPNSGSRASRFSNPHARQNLTRRKPPPNVFLPKRPGEAISRRVNLFVWVQLVPPGSNRALGALPLPRRGTPIGMSTWCTAHFSHRIRTRTRRLKTSHRPIRDWRPRCENPQNPRAAWNARNLPPGESELHGKNLIFCLHFAGHHWHSWNHEHH